MLGKLFSNKELDAFAKSLATSLVRRYPPSLDKAESRRISVTRVSKVLEDVLEKAAEYNRNNKLGVYKKARLGNQFKWELKELGYSDEFIDLATEGLIVYMSRKQPGAADNPVK